MLQLGGGQPLSTAARERPNYKLRRCDTEESTGRMEILCQKNLELEAELSLLAEIQSQGKNTEEIRASLFLLLMEQIIFIIIINKKKTVPPEV